ncbi:preprotein translocase subunit SecD [Pedobacter sp. MC2016-14]|uniref:preprotein translocase subunit SecD n=1 Tax=Pedobacter sp. MC2016-14 TaxID=2897327 RepID=UPI001E3D7743|nr:preprotein translocase subunit SecD [Pedobacter sp. MC2016-14]MCD0488996.1 preprotein translocase subunit SecD [Pedobacter sp. MC2016-14]
MTSTSAQQQNPKDSRYKKYAGRYGNSSGIVLFEDGTYLLYGYATLVFGTYRFEKDQLLFSADRQELFEVFAHHNPSLKTGARINFIGFERGSKTYAQLANDSIRPVFNENANCFDAPFVYLKSGKLAEFTLAALPPEFHRSTSSVNTSFSYVNNAGYNDFIFVHNATKREYEDFVAIIVATEKGEVIKLSNYGGEKGYLKQKQDKGEQQWKEVLDLKSQYEQEKRFNKDVIYANQHYNTFPKPETARYVYDKKENLYTALEAKENKSRYMQDQYNDPSYLRQYQKLAPKSKSEFKIDVTHLAKSLFFTVCGEGAELSYKYNGFIEYKIQHEQIPVVLPPVKP